MEEGGSRERNRECGMPGRVGEKKLNFGKKMDQARRNLLAALDGDADVQSMEGFLSAYADTEQEVKLRFKARELLAQLQNGQPNNAALKEEMRRLIDDRRQSTKPTVMFYGVAGQARMGKDTVGQMIVRTRTDLCTRAFATPVKAVLCKTFGVSTTFIEEWKVKNELAPSMHVTMRQALQTVGDGLRTIRSSVWIDLALDGVDGGVFCDVRYVDEARALRARGATLILVGRTTMINDDCNPSEAMLRDTIHWFLHNTRRRCVRVEALGNVPSIGKEFDWFIRNDGSLEELQAAVDSVMRTEERP